MRRLFPALVLSAALLAGGCTNPSGRVDYGRTALLGAGVGAAAAPRPRSGLLSGACDAFTWTETRVAARR